MKVLVTGAGGHIGGAAARHLADAGHEVLGVTRRVAALPGGIARVTADLGDVFDDQLAPVLDGCEAIVHCAADLSDDAVSLAPTRVNALATHALLLLAAQCGVQRFVHISGFNVLGTPCEWPITEAHPCAPRGIYATSKHYAEQLVQLASAAGSVNGVILRVSSPVGPGLRRKRIFSICADAAAAHEPITLHGQGGRRQDFVDVRDVAHGIEAALTKPVQGIVNIASGRAVSNWELAETCIEALGSPSTIVSSGEADPDETVRWEISIERARANLGFEPRFPLADSVRDYHAWKSGTR